MKRAVKALTASLLCFVLLSGALIPAGAWEWPEVTAVWQDYIETVTPVGDAPYVKMQLTYTGYVFTDWSVPAAYDIVMKDGSTQRCTIADKPDLFADGYVIGYFFDADAGDRTITLCAMIEPASRNAETCVFEVGEYITTPAQGDDGPLEVYSFAPITTEPCDTEVDGGNVPTRIVFWFYNAWQTIRRFVTELYLKLSGQAPVR